MKLALTSISTAIAAISLSALTAQAQNYPYPHVSQGKAERDLPCYMHTNSGDSIDLSQWCVSNSRATNTSAAEATTVVPASTRSGTDYTSDPAYPKSSRAAGGNCEYEWQTDASGRRCGGRASSKKAGGR